MLNRIKSACNHIMCGGEGELKKNKEIGFVCELFILVWTGLGWGAVVFAGDVVIVVVVVLIHFKES